MLTAGTYKIDLYMTCAKQVGASIRTMQGLTAGAMPVPSTQDIEAQAREMMNQMQSDPETVVHMDAITLEVIDQDLVLRGPDGTSSKWTVLKRTEAEAPWSTLQIRTDEYQDEWRVMADDDHLIFECSDSVGEYVWRRQK